MPDEFRSFAEMLAVPLAPAQTVEPPPQAIAPAGEVEEAVCALLREMRFFRAHLREAFDEALGQLLEDVASEVVARELRLQPAQIAGVVEAAMERYGAAEVVRLRVHPDDVAALEGFDAAVAADATLRNGDVRLECRGGAIELGLGVRLASVLRRTVR